MKHLRKITAILTIVIGIAVIILGSSLGKISANYDVNTPKYSGGSNYYDAEYASFGGDFYTYIYGAADTIVDELYEMNLNLSLITDAQTDIIEAVAVNVEATNDLIKTMGKVGSTIVTAIGLAIIASGLMNLGAAFTPSEKKPEYIPVQAPVQAHVYPPVQTPPTM